MTKLLVEYISSEGSKPIGELATSEVLIGREPESDTGITVPHNAVSRNHGVFIRASDAWFYKDLESTNGSWINGKPVVPGHWRLIRPGMVLQLADAVIRLNASSDLSAQVQKGPLKKFYVFLKGNFVRDFIVPDYGTVFRVGGAETEFPIEGDLYEAPALVVEHLGEHVTVRTVNTAISSFLNEEPIESKAVIRDLDTIKVADYSFVFSDLSGIHSTSLTSATTLNAWGDEHSRQQSHSSGKLPFGQVSTSQDDEEETLAIAPDEMEARMVRSDVHPSMRYQLDTTGAGDPFSSPEDRLILFIGLLLLIVLMVFVVLWVFF
ncbi:MAG: FHA domain-containing protein [Candidatus Dadabacteria bacterium]|nr:MAG: FHA domain-containing protein [Candidatus Dadabacteria bacterium]